MTDSSALVEQWIAVTGGGSKATAATYRYAISKFLAAVEKPLGELTAEDCLRFMAAINSTSLAPSTRAAYVSAARSFLRFLEDAGVLVKSPISVLRRPRVQVTSFNRYLTPAEARQVMAACKPSETLPMALALSCGLRVSELASAVWSDLYVDPEGRRGLRVSGKGGKVRVVGVSDSLWSLIRADREGRRLSTDFDARDHSPLIADRDGTHYTRQGLYALVRRASRRAGLSKQPSPHWLRHTHATTSAVVGTAPYQLQKDLGHASINTTMIYVNWATGLAGSGSIAVANVLIAGKSARPHRSRTQRQTPRVGSARASIRSDV